MDMQSANDPRSSADAAAGEKQSAQILLRARLGKTYRLLRRIGAGASSIIYEAEHMRLGKRFAVKMLRPDIDPTHRVAQRFRREGRAIATLTSEHIVSVVD